MERKTLICFRHAENKGDCLTSEGIQKAQRRKLHTYYYADLFYGPLFRSLQTLAALISNSEIEGRIHLPIEEIGSANLFKKMFTSKVIELLDTGQYNLYEALKEAHGQVKIKEWCNLALSGVKKMFGLMEDNIGIAVGHMPIIPFAAMALGVDFHPIDHLESITFEMDEKGNIIVIS